MEGRSRKTALIVYFVGSLGIFCCDLKKSFKPVILAKLQIEDGSGGEASLRIRTWNLTLINRFDANFVQREYSANMKKNTETPHASTSSIATLLCVQDEWTHKIEGPPKKTLLRHRIFFQQLAKKSRSASRKHERTA